MMFNEQKVAQMAAVFLSKTPDHRMSHLKLMKLLYISDREAVRKFGFPISGDHFVSMQHGPVLSNTLNLMDGDVESKPHGWEYWISDKENHELSLRISFTQEMLDELSKAELKILDHVWDKFGLMGKWEIRDWTHEHCAEWVDPLGSSCPINFESLVRAVDFDNELTKELVSCFKTEQDMDKLFASL